MQHFGHTCIEKLFVYLKNLTGCSIILFAESGNPTLKAPDSAGKPFATAQEPLYTHTSGRCLPIKMMTRVTARHSTHQKAPLSHCPARSLLSAALRSSSPFITSTNTAHTPTCAQGPGLGHWVIRNSHTHHKAIGAP